MKKIPTIFIRDMSKQPALVTDECNPECLWVFKGEGTPTRKWDGTCVMLDEDGNWWARREVRPGKEAPPNFQPLETDPNTGKIVGWEPIEQASHYKAFLTIEKLPTLAGTYELCGPKVNGNPEGFEDHVLLPHGLAYLTADPRSFDEIKDYLSDGAIEGIVWHHEDGRRAKIKGKDFGIRRRSNR